MTQDLVPVSSSGMTSWTPKEQKYVSWGVSGLGIAGATVAAAWGVILVAPTMVEAVGLVHQLFDGTLHAMLSLGGILAVGWVGKETFVPGGGINKLFAQYYNGVISRLTWKLLDIDPLTPIDDEVKARLADKAIFQEAFESFDGAIERLNKSEQDYRQEANSAEGKAKQAQKAGNQAAFDSLSYAWGSYNQAADRFAKMRDELIPTRVDITKILEGLDSLLEKLKIDRRVTSDMWGVQKDMSTMNKAARRMMGAGDRYLLAQQAAELVKTKYATEFGRLNNLKTLAKPLLESIDFEKGAYSEELLSRWNQAPKLLESSAAVPLDLGKTTSSVASLVR